MNDEMLAWLGSLAILGAMVAWVPLVDHLRRLVEIRARGVPIRIAGPAYASLQRRIRL